MMELISVISKTFNKIIRSTLVSEPSQPMILLIKEHDRRCRRFDPLTNAPVIGPLFKRRWNSSLVPCVPFSWRFVGLIKRNSGSFTLGFRKVYRIRSGHLSLSAKAIRQPSGPPCNRFQAGTLEAQPPSAYSWHSTWMRSWKLSPTITRATGRW